MQLGTYTDSGADVSETIAFEESFRGVVGHQETYHDPWNKVDKTKRIAKKFSEELAQYKALQVSSPVFAAGNQPVLIPIFVDPDIKLVQQRKTPVRELTVRKASQGKSYDFNTTTAIASGQTLAEGAALDEQDDTTSRNTVAIRFLYSVGKITGQMQAAARGYIDAGEFDMTYKAIALARLEENLIINGDNGTTATEYDGLIQGITTNTTDKSSAPVTLDDIRTSQDETFATAADTAPVAVTDPTTFSNIKKQLFSTFRQVDSAENLPFGVQNSFSFEGTDFIRSQFMPTASGSRRILFINPDAYHLAVLQDATFENLAKTGDFNKYMIKSYQALALTAESWMSQIFGIT